ncbi:MAG: DcrB-related protein [Candidatus Zixiibacteriota bacterium]|nr:MAG: DcrB-related protein [candidate division Zixibacteria bacterium]
MSSFESTEFFKVDLPMGWEDQTVYVFNGPDQDGMQHSIMITIDRQLRHETIASFAREKTDPLVDGLQGVDVLKDEETTIPGGNPAWEFVYKWVPSEDSLIMQKYVFVIKDNMGFAISAKFSRKSYKTVGLQLPKIIESLLPGTYEPLEAD